MTFDDTNPFKPFAGSRSRVKMQTPTSVAKPGKPLKPGQAAPAPKGTRPFGGASFSQAFAALTDSLTGNYNGPEMLIGPGARPYIKDYQPGKMIQAVVFKPKGSK